MKEFIEKLTGRLEEKESEWADTYSLSSGFDEYANGMSDGFEEAIEIVNQLAEEYTQCALCYLQSPCEYQNADIKLPEGKSIIETIANMLGVKLYEEFKIRPTKRGEMLGCKPIDKTFRFDTELVYKGYNDGWSEWYGFGCDKILYCLILGKYEIQSEGE